ncbi:type I polyketide synthase [Micromonospora sp. NPDC051543]|uniref:type I polyketide synthase n=1 Tax=Micromonospora sp. NPDC051543 TaxID=3364287 RepID=UPI00379357AD
MSLDTELDDAVAVIGMSCRFAPDLDSPEKFWKFLINGQSHVSQMPEKRWEPYAASSPQATSILRHTTRTGSFLTDIEGFDADFFGISPREAAFLDPQQRMMLELAWEALEAAGVPPLALRGSEVGVFMAANSNDYGRRLLEDIPRTGAWAVNGTTYYGIANRISYFLDLRGPSMAVDTACAGSLTALHLACQSLRSGEAPVALVGGINIMATPALFVALDAAGATSPDGRSKAFDKAADGYGRGEGAGLVVLKRWADARRDNDPVLALIRGSGVFQDGRSDGMMAPNSGAQEHMLRQTYARAGVDPGSVGYVEAHGTGTPVGDREEARALAQVFGANRAAGEPCLVGSVKPNIGHVEAGSGIAGVIKTVLALRHGEIPGSLHSEPNPDLNWEGSGLSLIGERLPWSAGEQPRRAGVSSYGVGGTIAHVIIEEAPPVGAEPEPQATDAPTVVPLSAMSEAGLRALAGEVAGWLDDHPDTPLGTVAHTLSHRRSHLTHRAGVVADSVPELAARLQSLAAGERTAGLITGRADAGQVDPVWVFSGHGAQWLGMGRELLRDEPVFADAMDALADVFAAEMGWTPREAIADDRPWTTARIQAMTFAMQIGLAEVWRRHGVRPAAVLGHSVGEIAAAVVAGALDLTEAARFACRRARALQRVDGRGAMALVGLSFAECANRLADRVDVVAAISASPRSTVVSGDRDAVEELVTRWGEEGLEARRVDTDVAFHSRHVDEVLDEVAGAAGELRATAAEVPLYSTALADPRSDEPRGRGYWTTNLRQPVRFVQAVEVAIEDGHRLFLEVSSHPVVAHSITETFDQLDLGEAAVIRTLRRHLPEQRTLLENLAELHCRGGRVDWAVEHADGGLVELPTMAWQHRPYWIFPPAGTDTGAGGGHDPDQHNLLGGRMTVSGAPARQVWQTHLDMSSRPYPQSHEVVGVEITPAAAIIETFVRAAGQDGRPPALSDIVLRTPLAVVPPRVVQVVLSENALRLSSRIIHDVTSADEEVEWITHTTATVDPGGRLETGRLDVDSVRARCPETWSWSRVDDLFRTKGVGGYAFPWDLDELRRSDEEQLSVLTLVPPPAQRSASWAHVIDGALTISAVLVTPENAHRLWMSSQIGGVVFDGEPPARITVHTRRAARSPEDTVDVLVSDDSGRIVCDVRGLRFAALQDQRTSVATRDLVHEVVWHPLPAVEPVRPLRRVALIGGSPALDTLAASLQPAGVRAIRVASPDDLDAALSEPVDAVLVSPDQTGGPTEQAAEEGAWMVIRTAQQLAAVSGQPRLWCLTSGVRTARDEAAVAHAPLWGIGRIIGGEHPELWGGVVDVDVPATATADRLLPLLGRPGGEEDVISVTGDGTASVARLGPIPHPTEAPSVHCRPGGTYLITGGLGALGLAVARWLVDRGATRLLLVGRQGLPPRVEWPAVRGDRLRQQIDEVLALEALGVTVRVLALDVTDAEQVAIALDPATHGLPPVRGIIHAAGVVRDAMVDNVVREDLREVLRPKADGAMVLHRLYPPGSLDFFVLFSSCGQFARLTGQTTYAAANSFLDALAAHRQALGGHETRSIGWTSWREMGMSDAIGSTMLEANSRGLEAVTAAEAFRSWAFADRYASPYQAVLRVLPLPPHSPRLPMFRELTAPSTSLDAADGEPDVLAEWASLPDREFRERVSDDVREQVAAELNLLAEEVELRRPLIELGVDSVMSVALRVRLTRRYGVELPPTILWNRPSVAALAAHLADTLRSPDEDEEPADAADPALASA